MRDTKDNLQRDFVKTYLARQLLLFDKDFTPHNFGILTNKENKEIKLAPNFDLEYCINDLSNSEFVTRIPENMQFIYDRYPDILSSFINKSRELISVKQNSKTDLQELLEQDNYDQNFKDETTAILNNNISIIEKSYKNTKCHFFGI